jgi:dethiobiotin synthetase
MPRIVVLGCGTGVGKTRVSAALLQALRRRGCATLGLKPIESGVARAGAEGSDAAALNDASSLRSSGAARSLYALAAPVSPHLAARAAGLELDVAKVESWVTAAEAKAAPHIGPHMAIWTVVESAGGVFSPLSMSASNFDLAQALEPAIWLLVAADALGVLHDVSATMQALRARSRLPDHVVLSGAREPDPSTGTNAAELAALGIVTPRAVLARNDDRGIEPLVDLLLAHHGGR